MHSAFDFASFDSHPAFRSKRGFPRKDARCLSLLRANVWPLPSIGDTRPRMQSLSDGVLFSYDHASPDQLPPLLPIFAVSDANVEYAGKIYETHSIVLDHGDGHRSAYYGLAHMFVMATSTHRCSQRVRAGDVLGYQPRALNAVLRFSITRCDSAGHFHPTDAADLMQSWAVLPLAHDHTTPPTNHTLAA